MLSWLNTHFDARDHGKFVERAVLTVIIGVSLTIGGCVVTAKYAGAHEAVNTAGQPLGWTYSFACCSNQDCRPVAADEVRETPEGYLLVKTGEVVGYQDARVKESPDGTWHVCQVAGDFDAGRILCIYAPGRGY